MPKRNPVDRSFFIAAVAIASWLIPGAGFAMQKEFKRAAVVFIAISSLFVAGIYIGSLAIIDHKTLWYYAQIVTSPIVHLLSTKAQTAQLTAYGRPFDYGQLYTSVAGMLNLLCIIHASYMAYYGRTELIGEEDA